VHDRDGVLPNALNFGPDTETAQPVDWLLDRVIETLRAEGQQVADWAHVPEDGPAEARNLALDAALAAKTLGWRPRLSQADAAAWTARWHAGAATGTAARELVSAQINAYCERADA